MTEAEIVRSCQNNDPRGQRALFDTYSNRLFRTGYRYLRDDLEAEDAVIIACTHAFRTIGSFTYKGQGSLEAWLRKIVINEALMVLRRRHNFHLAESIDERQRLPDWHSFSELPPDDIYKMVASLPTGYRTVFNLYVIEGYQHDEIAKLLNIAEGTSRSQLFKAKLLLQQLLTQEGYHYGT